MKQLIRKNSEVILNRAKYYYEYYKELLRERERAKNKYRELSEEEKNIKGEYGKKRYHNMSEEKKQKLKEYQKIIEKQKNNQKIIRILILPNKISSFISVIFSLDIPKNFNLLFITSNSLLISSL